MGNIRICEKHGEYISNECELFGCVVESGCPECEKLQAEREKAENEAEMKAYREMSMLDRGIESDYFTATLDDFIAENESERLALQAARELDEGAIEKLLLTGSNGVGKTLIGCALARKHNGVRITMYELSARIRAGYSKGASELEILNELLAYPFICLDEIGRTKGSEAEKNWMSYLIDKAHTRHKKLLLISNRQTARNLPPERRGEALENFFDNDVISRLRQNSKIVEVVGRDRRST